MTEANNTRLREISMRISQLFIKSLYSIKAISFFRFQKIERTISYLFTLSFLISLPSFILFFISFINKMTNNTIDIFEGSFQGVNEAQMEQLDGSPAGMVPVFVFLTLLFIFLGVAMLQFISVSILAAVGILLKRILGRNLNYKQLWNIAAYSITLPSILIGLSELIPYTSPTPFLPFAIYFFASLLILFFAIRKVPVPRNIKK